MAHRHIWVLFCALFAGPLAHAATTTSTTDEAPAPAETTNDHIVVTASRIEEPQRRAPAAISELPTSRLDQGTGGAVVEALRLLPGLEVFQSGGPGTVTSLQLRGANTAHTLVLLDGQRLNHPTTGQFDFADLQGVELDRVEVVRGPQSALWGSEAIGGVVNLISASPPAGHSGRLRAGVGEGSVALAGAGYGLGGERMSTRVAIDAEEGTPLSVADRHDGNSEADQHRVAQASLRTTLDLGDSQSLGLTVRHLDSAADLDGFDFPAGPVDDPNYRQQRQLTAASVSYDQNHGAVGFSGRLGIVDEDLSGEDPDTFFNNFAITARTTDLSAQANLATGLGLTSIGLSYEQRQAENVGIFDERLSLAGLFAQQRLDLGSCVVSLGGRYDDHEAFGGATTGRLGTSCALGAKLVAHASVGSGFRAPSLNELVYPFFGNPDLQPEFSTGGDLGLRWSSGTTEISLGVFAQRFRDLIGTGPDFTALNVNRARTEGIEAELRAQLGPVEVNASYTLLESEDEASGDPLPRRPRHRATLWVEWEPLPRLSTSLGIVAVADRVDVGGSALDDYQRVDFGARYRVLDRLTLALTVGNILDERYQEVAGYGTPGRLARVAATWSW